MRALSSPEQALLDRVERRMRALVRGDGDADDLVAAAAEYHLDAGGGRVRARLALSAARALRVDDDDATSLACTVELLHNASLVHDDVQDRDRRRRGREAVWVAYGGNTAVCVGDLLLSAAYGALAGLSVTSTTGPLVRLVHRRTAEVIAAQTRDLAVDVARFRSFEDYERIASGKSTPLLSLPLELTLQFAGHGRALETARVAARAFAIGYQIADDLADATIDARAGGVRPSVNAVLVLHALGVIGARRAAAVRARDALADAARLAHALPDGSGESLAAFADALSDRLAAEAATPALACAL